MRVKSISTRMSRQILTITTLVFIAALITTAILSVETISKEIENNVTKSLDNTILDIENSLTQVDAAVEAMSGGIIRFREDERTLFNITKGTVDINDLITSCAIAFEPFKGYNKSYYCVPFTYLDKKTGETASKDLGGPDYDYRTMDWYQIPKLTGKSYWGEPSFNPESKKMVTSYSTPLFDADGEFYGVLRADVNVEWLGETIAEFKPYPHAYTLLIGRNGSFICHIDKSKILNETIFSTAYGSENSALLKELGMRMIAGDEDFISYREDHKGKYAAFGPLKNGWSALMICPYEDVYKETKKMNIYLFLIAVLGLILLYAGSKRIIRRLTAPVTEITYSALNMSRGVFNASIPEVKPENDEIQHLHDSLLYLQKTITRYIEELKSTTASNERFESELNIANAIQMNMLKSEFPENKDYDIFATLSPAKEVGGDLYDFFQKDRELYFVVGDVSGKGVPAALYMAILRYGFRFIANMSSDTAYIVSKLNNSCSEGNTSGMFATMFVGKINLDTYEMEYCNGGHNPIVVISSEGKPEYLHAKSNIAVGLFGDFSYESEKLQLSKGSRLMLYTDGVSEAEDKQYNQYGEDRLIEFCKTTENYSSSKELVAGLLDSVKEFTSGNDQNDDITIMSIKL